MSHIRLSLATGNPPKEKVIYVPENWQTQFGDDFLKKLIQVLDQKKVFNQASTEGFYISYLAPTRKNEFHLKIRNLSDLEAGMRPVTLSLDQRTVELSEQINKEIVSYNPVQRAQEKEQQAVLQAQAAKIEEAQKRQLLKGKKKILLHEFVIFSKGLKEQRLREQEKLKREQERLKSEQAKEKARLEAKKLIERMQILSAALPKRQVPEEQLKKADKAPVKAVANKKIKTTANLPARGVEAIKLVLEEFNPLVRLVKQQEAQTEELKAQLKLNGVDFGSKALAYDLEKVRHWQLKLTEAVQSVIDEQDALIDRQIQKIKEEAAAHLKAAVTPADFTVVYLQLIRDYNETYPDLQIQKSGLNELNKEIEGIYDANYKAKRKFSPPVKLSRKFENFEKFFNEGYQQQREEQEKKRANLKYGELMEELKAETVDDWVRKFKSPAVNRVYEEVQQYKSTLRQNNDAALSFNESLREVCQNFNELLAGAAGLEEEVKKVKLTPLLRERVLEHLHFTRELVGGIEPKLREGWRKRFDAAIFEIHGQLRPSEDWTTVLSSNKELKKIFAEINGYKQDMQKFKEYAKDLEVTAVTSIPEIDSYLRQGKEKYELIEDIHRLVDHSDLAYELKAKMRNLRQSVADQINLMHYDRRQMINASPREAESILDAVVSLRKRPEKIEEAYLGAQGLAVQVRILASQSKALSTEQLAKLSNEDISLLNAQLELLETIKKVILDVPFWNQQVSGLRGPKIEFWDSKKNKKVSLYVPDGIGTMVQKIINNETLSVESKLLKIQHIAAVQLTKKGFFGIEKPMTRRAPTQDFYKLMKSMDLMSPEGLRGLVKEKLEPFVVSHQVKKEVAKEKKVETLFHKSSPKLKHEEKETVLAKRHKVQRNHKYSI